MAQQNRLQLEGFDLLIRFAQTRNQVKLDLELNLGLVLVLVLGCTEYLVLFSHSAGRNKRGQEEGKLACRESKESICFHFFLFLRLLLVKAARLNNQGSCGRHLPRAVDVWDLCFSLMFFDCTGRVPRLRDDEGVCACVYVCTCCCLFPTPLLV